MATFGVIADVHGNLEALTAVLAALARQWPDRLVCLGDLVGYNAEPNECVALIRQQNIDCIAGNHDLIALERLGFDRCAMRPEFTLRRTRKALIADTRRYLGGLPAERSYEEGRVVMIHGGVGDVCEYVRSPDQVATNAARLKQRYPEARLCLFGHTHEAGIYEVAPGAAVSYRPAGTDPVPLDRERLTFINPGSVDAARRPEKLAQFLVFDTQRWTATFHYVPYDHEESEAKAANRGYRMKAADEATYTARRLVRRGRRRASAVAQALLGWRS